MRFPSFFIRNNSYTLLSHIFMGVLVIILYGAVFLIPLPPQIRKQGIFLVDEFMVFVLLALVFFTYGRMDWVAKYFGLAMVLIMFSLPLLRLWDTAESTWNIVLGLLPWGDAKRYFSDANRLIEGNLFSVFSGRRPLYASLLAVFLKLTNQNLQLVLIVFAMINGLAVFLFSEEIRNEFGSISALIGLYLCHFFYRPFVGTALTEQFGFPIGLLGFVGVLRGVKDQNLKCYALGVMLITFALLIRAGTFFVLPLLTMFGVLNFAANRGQYLKVFLVVAAAVVIPVLANSWLGRAVAVPNSVPFGNFAETLYGQARGGLRWTQAAAEHPELSSMPEPSRSRELYRLAFEEIRNNPSGLVKGSVKALTDFIVPGPLSAFGFLSVGNKIVDFLIQVSASLMFLAGIWLATKDRKNIVSQLVLVYFIGTFLSIPFLPPVDAGIRPYSATIASVFLPIIFAVSSLFFRYGRSSHTIYRAIPVSVPYCLALTLLLTSVAGGPILRSIVRPLTILPTTCEPGLVPIHIKLTYGSYLFLTLPGSGQKTQVPIVSIQDVHRSFDDFPYGDFATLFRKMRQPVLTAVVNDLSTGRSLWIVGPPELGEHEGKTISACAALFLPQYHIMIIETIIS